MYAAPTEASSKFATGGREVSAGLSRSGQRMLMMWRCAEKMSGALPAKSEPECGERMPRPQRPRTIGDVAGVVGADWVTPLLAAADPPAAADEPFVSDSSLRAELWLLLLRAGLVGVLCRGTPLPTR